MGLGTGEILKKEIHQQERFMYNMQRSFLKPPKSVFLSIPICTFNEKKTQPKSQLWFFIL